MKEAQRKIEELTNNIAAFHQSILELEKLEPQHTKILEELLSDIHSFTERIKELDCLHSILNLVTRHDTSIDNLLKEAIVIIPTGWQHPEIACARIWYEDKEFKTSNYQKTPWKETSHIIIFGDRRGALEVNYLEATYISGKDSFVNEKRTLFDAVARQLSRVIENVYTEEARSYLASIVESSNDAIIGVTLDGIIISWNDGAKALYGYTTSEAIYNPLSMLIPPEYPNDIPQIIEKIKSGKKVERYETVRLTKTGKRVDVAVTLSPIVNVSKNIIGVSVITRDITERKIVEAQLRNSETRFRELFENISSGVAIFEAIDGGSDFIIKDLNKVAGKIEHIKKEDVIGKRIMEVFPAIKSFGIFEVFQRVYKTGASEFFPQALYADHSNPETWRENWVYKIPSGEIVAIYDDITDRIQTGMALRESEARYRSLFQNASDGILVRELDGRITIANKATADLTGYEINELVGMNISKILPTEHLTNVMEKQQELLESHSDAASERYEIRLIRKDGTERIVEAVTALLYLEGRSPIVQAIIRDVTEQRFAHEQIRSYANQVLRAQEEERMRIARELHDETIQDLLVLSRELDDLASNETSKKKKAILENLWQQISNTAQGIRRLSQDLRPPALDKLGLLPGLNWLASDIEKRSAIIIKVTTFGTEKRLAPEKELLLFRISQEALTNIWRHSGATQAEIKVYFEDSDVSIEIEDNGKGFDTSNAKGDLLSEGRLGLAGMRERAQMLNGYLNIESKIGLGTTVTVRTRK